MTDAVDPKSVPFRTLKSGAKIPVVGLGTFGSDAVTGEQIAAAVLDAASVGYRHFDCASVYGNEHLIGPSLKQIVASEVPRADLWVTSKVWNDQHKAVEASCEKSLRDLQLDYLDCYLVHWPFPNFHPPGCAPDYHNPDARAYLHDEFMATWAQMERLQERGLVRHIGTSNVTIPKLRLILRDARIKPAVNEMELHPHFQQGELYEFVTGNEILPIGYSPLGSPGRPERDRTPEDTVDTEDPVIVRIAQRLAVHPAAVCLKWAIQRGEVVIPFSAKRKNYLANLQASLLEPLTTQDMQDIAEIDQECRLIKGQVFLWKEGQTWEALWDLDGEITPP